MNALKEYAWSIVGVTTLCLSLSLLYREFHGTPLWLIKQSALTLPLSHYAFAILSSVCAYLALAWYDKIALSFLNITHMRWKFIALCSFTTYALSHNIGATIFSAGLVRYRAYRSKNVSTFSIALITIFCSFTFVLGAVFLTGLVLIRHPEIFTQLTQVLPEVPRFMDSETFVFKLGALMLSAVALYFILSLLPMPKLRYKSHNLAYPKPGTIVNQLLAACIEISCAASIIYWCLPEHVRPDFLSILTVFIVTFSLSLISHSPGGLGVFEYCFISCMPTVPKESMLAALLLFRMFYLVLPFIFALLIVVIYEKKSFLALFKKLYAPNKSSQ